MPTSHTDLDVPAEVLADLLGGPAPIRVAELERVRRRLLDVSPDQPEVLDGIASEMLAG